MPLCEVCPINNQLHSELVCSYCSRDICRVCTRNGSVCFLCHERELDADEEVQSDDFDETIETVELMNLQTEVKKQQCILCGEIGVVPPILSCEACRLKPPFSSAHERDKNIIAYNMKYRPAIRYCSCGVFVYMSHVIVCKGCNVKFGCSRCMVAPCESCKLNISSCFLCGNKANLKQCICTKSTCSTCVELGVKCCSMFKEPEPSVAISQPVVIVEPPDNMEPIDLATLRHNEVMAAIAALSEKIDKIAQTEKPSHLSDLHRNYLARRQLGLPY